MRRTGRFWRMGMCLRGLLGIESGVGGGFWGLWLGLQDFP